MTTGATLGTMPVGAGPVGGVFGTDLSGPQVLDISPAPDSGTASPKPTIRFKVFDFGQNLDPYSVQAKVNGVTVLDVAQPGQFFNGWVGSLEELDFGLGVTLVAPDFLGDAAVVNVEVLARDTNDTRMDVSWSFTTFAKLKITGVEVISETCLTLSFTPGLVVNGQLYNPSNFGFAVRLGYAKEIYAKQVTPPIGTVDAVVNSVKVCMRDFMSRGGRYSVRISGPTDEFGRTVSTDEINFTAGE